MPEVDGSAQCKEALQSLFQGGEKEPVILGEGEAIELIASLDEIKKSISDLETIKREKENRLGKMLGDHEYGLAGERKVSWKLQAGKVTVDVKRLKTDHPDIYKKYSKIGKPFRVLRLG